MPQPEQSTEHRAARLSQDRSRERHQKLLEATLTLLVESGRDAVTHRSVAATAGVSISSVGYYFATVDDLVTEAIGTELDRWRLGFDEVGASTVTNADEVLTLLRHAFGDSSHEERMRTWSLYMEALRHPETAERLAAVIESIRAALTRVVADLELDERLPDLIMVAITGTSVMALGRRDSNDRLIEALVSSIGYFMDAAEPVAKSIATALESFED